MVEYSHYDAVVIGGGFFGCTVSLYLKKYLKSVLVVEKEADLLQRASYVNQARVHHGYHYPRSFLTALRSKVNFGNFVSDYQDCIVDTFNNYYAVSSYFSKVNARQFKTFCQRVNIPVIPAPPAIKKIFNSNLIEEVFEAKEYVFDAVKLKDKMLVALEKYHISIKFDTEVTKVVKSNSIDKINVVFNTKFGEACITAKYIFNCTYSAINTILDTSELTAIPLKHELAEMVLVQVPESLNNIGITVMCGPFFSLMPFPSKQLHTLSHVRYTPHCYWQDTENTISATSQIYRQAARKTNYPYMIRDAARYLPVLSGCSYVDSLWEVKTVLPQSEVDDSRPILFKRHPQLPNLTCILGGKIDNVYDIFHELQFLESEGNNN
jgi:glycine/D-amino acid oxidase-like deaminating enzyme